MNGPRVRLLSLEQCAPDGAWDLPLTHGLKILTPDQRDLLGYLKIWAQHLPLTRWLSMRSSFYSSRHIPTAEPCISDMSLGSLLWPRFKSNLSMALNPLRNHFPYTQGQTQNIFSPHISLSIVHGLKKHQKVWPVVDLSFVQWQETHILGAADS